VTQRTEQHRLSRRSFFELGTAAAAAVVLPGVAVAEVPAEASADDYYAKLGVPTLINAAGTYTYLTAAVMPPSVQRAVAAAAHHPVRLKELHAAAGEYIAKRLRCEAALVTSGASAALTLATAASIAAKGGLKPEEIPQAARERGYEVIVQKSHRYEYDHAMILCGVNVREVTTVEEYRKAFNERTVMTNYFNDAAPENNPSAQIDRETWLRVAHEHNVPCHVDAAADMPPIENLWKYTGMGFDFVCFSGGKGIRGPQNAGLLLGKKKLIDLAAENDSPNSDAVGRGMKVAKEQIVGMVAAVDWILAQDETTMQREFLERAHHIQAALKDVPTLKSEIFMPKIANHVPHLFLRYDPKVIGITPLQVADRLRAQNPPIELNPATGSSSRLHTADENTIVLTTWMLQPGETELVAAALRKLLTQTRAS
jgi:L-seryl-tRNA(Ser) seleniumtransferase